MSPSPFSRFLAAFWLSIATGTFLAHSAAAAPPSAFCAEAGLASLSISGLPRAGMDGEACARRPEDLPPVVAAIVRRIGEIHRAVATALGQTFAETVGDGIPLTLFGHPDGSIASYTLKDGSRIMLTVFRDSDLRIWPEVTYAHELAHLLELRPGSYREALRGLKDFPFVTEALPDLVAFTSRDRAVMPFEDANLPACLRISRDQSTQKTLADPAGEFELHAASREMSACCATLLDRGKSGAGAPLCQKADPESEAGFFVGMRALGADLRATTAAERAVPFRPEQCLYRVKGRTVFGACSPYAFSGPLSSFFFTLKREVGRHLLPEWMRALRASAGSRDEWNCRFVRGGEAVRVELRGVARSLRAIRNGLAPLEKVAFDRVWRAHAFDRVAELDALFLGQAEIQALLPLTMKNPSLGGGRNGCASPFTADPQACAVRCERVTNSAR